jgi:hypothetical protein
LADFLNANPQAMAVLAYQEQTLRSWNLSAGSIDGVTPGASMIRSGSYPGARAIYLYANIAVPHMRDFALAVWSSVGGAPGDAPSDASLISVDPDEWRSLRKQALALTDLKF